MNIVVDISSQAALKAKGDLLLIKTDEGIKQFRFDSLSCVLLTSSRVSLTQQVLSRLGESGVVLVSCNYRYLPTSISFPMQGNYKQGEIFRKQFLLNQVRADALWAEIVRAKIGNQKWLLEDTDSLIKSVESGDRANVEAVAARQYWLRFGGAGFSRNQICPLNAHLNYGYTVLRALMIRALSISGLHPSLSIKHSPFKNSFCLADDLMEPLRPVVDKQAYGKTKFEAEDKKAILSVLTGRIDGANRPVWSLCLSLARSLVRYLDGETFNVPDISLA